MKDKSGKSVMKPEERKDELAKRIRLCEEYKKNIILIAKNLKYKRDKELVSEIEYKHQLYSQLQGKEPEEWLRYYDDHIRFCNREIEKAGRASDENWALLKNIAVVVALLSIMFSGIFFGRYVSTGFTILDEADIFAGQDTYTVGDMAHIFVTPPGIDYDIEVYGPDNELYAVSLDFPVEKAGTYTVKAKLSYENISRKITTEFNAVEEEVIPPVPDENMTIGPFTGSIIENQTENQTEINISISKLQPDMTNATVNATGENRTAPAASTPIVLNISLAAGTFSKKREVIFEGKDMMQEYTADEKKGVVPIVKMEKGGVKIEIKGAEKNKVKDVWYKDEILHIDSMKIDEAVISIPHEPLSGILANPKLYIKGEGDAGFTLATPYEKNGKSYNKVSITPEHYEFNVEHFTEYAINSTGDFATISGCLKYINNTADTCTITSFDTEYTIHKWLINSTDLNKSNNLSAAFDFDRNDNPTWDTSNQANNGTIMGGATWNAIGFYGGAYDFDGTGFINASNFTWPAGSAVTVSLWVNTAGCIVGCSAFDAGHDGSNRLQAHLPWTDNILYWDYGEAGGTGRTSTDFTPYLNKWTHVALVSSGSANIFRGIYINGRLAASAANSDAPDVDLNELLIGASFFGETYYYNEGSIDQFRIWNRSLSTTEIEQLYAGDVQKYNLSGDAIILTNITYEGGGAFKASYSPVSYSGADYDETTGIIVVGVGPSISCLNTDDTEITWADGTTDVYGYAFDFTTNIGCGTGKGTVYMHPDVYATYTCAFLQDTAGYGTCACDEGVFWDAQGATSDYVRITDTCGFTIASGYTDPSYLKYYPNPKPRTGNITLNLNGSTLIGDGEDIGIRVLNNNNTISNVTFYNWTSSIYVSDNSQNNTIRYSTFDFSKIYDLNISGDYSNVYLNSFYSKGVNDTGTGNSYCTADAGNFYWEGVANSSIALTDCGISNITRPAAGTNYSASINTTWHNQSSIRNISYYLLYSLDGTAWTNIARVYDVQFYNWSIASLAHNYSYQFKVIPFDDNYNATNRIERFGAINGAPIMGSVLLNATSPDNLTFDNLTAYVYGAADPEGDNIELNYNWYRNGASDTVLNMPMTAPDGDNREYDFSGYNNHGNVTGGATWNATGGYNGLGAYQFDGVNDFINLSDTNDVEGSTQMTVSAWVKRNEGACTYGTTARGIVAKGLYNPYILYWSSGTDCSTLGYAFAVKNSSGNAKIVTYNPGNINNQWHHLVGAYNGTRVLLYYDGVLRDSEYLNGSIASSTSTLGIGYAESSRWFNGSIDDVRIYNRSLSINEIRLLYENKTNVTHSDATGAAGENWTVKVTPIDQHGLNGTSNFSNGLNITQMVLYFVNQTNQTGDIINESNPIIPDQDLTIRVNATAVGGGLESVWVVVWATVKSAANIIWQGIMSLIGGFWQVNVPINGSYPRGLVNYTVYANFTGGNVTQIEGNFSVQYVKNYTVNSSGANFSTLTDCLFAINNTYDYCLINGEGAWNVNNSYSFNLSGHGIMLDADNIILDCNGTRLIGHGSEGDYGIYNYRQGSNITIRNCIVQGFGRNYYLDAYQYNNITVINCTSISGTQADSEFFAYGTINITNFTTINSKTLSLLSNSYSLFQDITVVNGSGISLAGAVSSTLRRANISSYGRAAGNYVLDVTDATDSIVEDSLVDANGGTAVRMATSVGNILNATLRNSTIKNGAVGIYLNAPKISIVNNTITNFTGQGIQWNADNLPDLWVNVTDNMIMDTGNTTSASMSNASYSPQNYTDPDGNNINFSTCVMFLNSGASDVVFVTSNKTTIPHATGLNNYSLWLYQEDDSPYFGCGDYANITAFVDRNFGLSCPTIAGLIGGVCYLEWKNAFNGTGVTGNYTWDTNVNSSTIKDIGLNPPYLATQNRTVQSASPLEVRMITNNYANITRNIIGITDGRPIISPMNLTGHTLDMNVWLNHFHSGSYVNASSVNGAVYLCNEGEGNLYEEDMIVPAGDCGQTNVTYPMGWPRFDAKDWFPANWTKQSSMKTVTYEIFANKTSDGTKTRLENTTFTNITLNASKLSGGNYTLFIIPWVNGSRINATNREGGNFTVNSVPSLTSVLLNATSPDNLTIDNLTASVSGVSDPEGDNVELNYNWYRNGISDTVLNMPMTAPDSLNRTYDFSGNNNHGVITNATWNGTAGHNGFEAYMFDGDADYITISNIIKLSNITLSVWVKLNDNDTASQKIIEQRQIAYSLSFYPSTTDTFLITIVNSSSNSKGLYATTHPSRGKWYHVAATYDNQSIRIYVNGVQENSVGFTGGLVTHTSPLYIGTKWSFNGEFFNGTIDDIRIYNRSLSANEIRLLYENKTNVTHADATGPAGENWTVKVTPIDSYGLNGSSVFSNGLNITGMVINFYNQTPSNIPTQIVNETQPINPNQNLTIRVNVTAVGGGLESVWIKVWQTIKSAANILWQGLMSFVNGFYQVDVPVNWTYPNGTNLTINYTIYANFTGGNVTQMEGNFSINAPPGVSYVKLNASSIYNYSTDNLTATATATDPDGHAVELNYNWYKNGTSDTVLNMPMTAPDWFNRTYDFSGFSYHGNITNATWNRTGGYNGFGAYEFDGVDDYVNLGSISSLSSSPTAITLSLWFKSYSGVLQDSPMGFGTALYMRIVSATSIGLRHLNWGAGLTDVTVPNIGNAWHHMAATFNGTNVIIYLDGVNYGGSAAAAGNLGSLGSFALGYFGPGSGLWSFNGSIDDVKLWNRTLSDNEIKLLYENKTNATHADATTRGENWTVKVTPIDQYGLNGTGVMSNGVFINNSQPSLASVVLNATSLNNLTTDNLTANLGAASDPDGDNIDFNYNWYRNGVSDIILNMPMTMPDGDNAVYDFSPYARHSIIYNGTIFNSTGGYNGFGACQFNGSSFMNGTWNVRTANITISAWFKTKSPVAPQSLFTISSASSTNLYFRGNSNELILAYRNSSEDLDTVSTTGDPIAANRWHHGVVTRNVNGNDVNVSLYLDGVFKQNNFEDEGGVSYSYISSYRVGVLITGGYFNGSIDDVRVYNRSLSESEIKLLYENKTNVTHADATTAGENWTVKVTPIDSYGMNGTSVLSNGFNITEMRVSFVNQTPSNIPSQAVNETEPINRNQNLTIRVNVTAVGGGLESVWIKIWQTVKSAANVLWEGIMSFIGGLWTAEVPVNWTYPNGTNLTINYTVYANFTAGNVTEIEGNFSINSYPTMSSVILNATSLNNLTTDNLTATPLGAADPDGDNFEINYNWYRNGVSDTVLNMPMTAPDWNNKTYDMSGYDNHGNLSNASMWNGTAGYNGFGAYEFDGVDDYISLGDMSSIEGIFGVTLSAWVYAKSYPNTYNPVMVKANSIYWTVVNDARMRSIYYNVTGGQCALTSTGAGVTANAWHYVTVTYNLTSVCHYRNGNLIGCSSGCNNSGIQNTANDMNLGVIGSAYWDGTIDNLRVYNRTLSANEIKLLYENKTNVTHADATAAGENWTVKATAIDQHGLNGSSVLSNGFNITGMVINFYNQTPSNLTTQIVNESQPINPNQNLTIRVNVTAVGGGLESVWVIVWQTIKSAALVLWQGLMTLVNGFYQVDVPINWSYPNGTNLTINYTIYANLTGGNVTELEGNFSINAPPGVTSAILNGSWYYNSSDENLTATAVTADPDGHAIELNYNWYLNGTSDTVLNMPFTAPDNNDVTYDFSGYNNHGNVSGAMWNRTGGYNGFGAYMFDGTDDAIKINDSNLFDFEDNVSFAISVWFKMNELGGYDDIVLKNGNYQLRMSTTGQLQFAFTNASDKYPNIYTPSTISANRWYHVVAVKNASGTSGMFMYVDGNLNTSSPTVGTATSVRTNPLTIGGTSTYFNGSIDDVRIYNRTLSPNEIKLLYENKTNVTHSDATGGRGENWTVKVTPIDQYGLNGTGVFSNSLNITNTGPSLASVLLNSTSKDNLTVDNLTATPFGVSDIEGDNFEINYNWYRNGASDTAFNMPFTRPDLSNRTYDFSGSNYHGNVTNASTWNMTGGYRGSGAYIFDGVNDYINASSFIWTAGSPITISLWVKTPGVTSGPAVAAGNNEGNTRFQVQMP